jgi:hypothetical protein
MALCFCLMSVSNFGFGFGFGFGFALVLSQPASLVYILFVSALRSCLFFLPVIADRYFCS